MVFLPGAPPDQLLNSLKVALSGPKENRPPFLSFRAEIGTQTDLFLRRTGRAQTNGGLLWPLISRSYAAPVPALRAD